MPAPSEGLQLTWADVERWATQGLIRPDQLEAIRVHVASAPGDLPESPIAPTPPTRQRAAARKERPAGLNMVTVAYYFGAFMILIAGTIFIGLQWETLGRAGQLAIACAVVAGLWGMGAILRQRGYVTGGNLLIFAGTGIVPLAIYTILRALNLWPDSSDADSYQAFYNVVDGAWLLLEIGSFIITLVVLWFVRFPLLTLLLAFWGWYFSMDMAEALTGHDDFQWGPTEWWVGLVVGLLMLALGAGLQYRLGGQEWSRWFYLFGHLAVLGNLGALALDGPTLLGLLFLAVYVASVVASVWLQSRMFLVFGAIGIYTYLAKLAFDVFDRSLGFALALGVIGLLIVLLTVAYQRYAEPWLAQRLSGARLSLAR